MLRFLALFGVLLVCTARGSAIGIHYGGYASPGGNVGGGGFGGGLGGLGARGFGGNQGGNGGNQGGTGGNFGGSGGNFGGGGNGGFGSYSVNYPSAVSSQSRVDIIHPGTITQSRVASVPVFRPVAASIGYGNGGGYGGGNGNGGGYSGGNGNSEYGNNGFHGHYGK